MISAYVLLLIYMLNGDLIVEKKTYETDAVCQVAGVQRANEITQNPGFERGYFAGCIEIKVKKA